MSALSVLIDNISKEKELEDDTLKLLQTLNTKSTNLQKSIKQINNSRSHNQLKYNIRDQLQRDLIATYKQYEEVFTLDKSAPIDETDPHSYVVGITIVTILIVGIVMGILLSSFVVI